MEALREEFALIPEERRKTIVKFVSEVYKQKTCIRCAIRFLCIHNVQLFNLSESDLVTFYHSLPETTPDLHFNPYPRDKDPCTLCLGILQDAEERKEPRYQAQILQSLKESGFGYKNFQFCLSLPYASIIRELAMIKQLQNEIG